MRLLRRFCGHRSASRGESDRCAQGIQVELLGTTAHVRFSGRHGHNPIGRKCAHAAVTVVGAGLGADQAGHGAALEVEARAAVALVMVLHVDIRHLGGRRGRAVVQRLRICETQLGGDTVVGEELRQRVATAGIRVAAQVIVAVGGSSGRPSRCRRQGRR